MTSTASDASATGSSTTSQGEGFDASLQSLFQQFTKAAATYASGGPAGLAASALSTTPPVSA